MTQIWWIFCGNWLNSVGFLIKFFKIWPKFLECLKEFWKTDEIWWIFGRIFAGILVKSYEFGEKLERKLNFWYLTRTLMISEDFYLKTDEISRILTKFGEFWPKFCGLWKDFWRKLGKMMNFWNLTRTLITSEGFLPKNWWNLVDFGRIFDGIFQILTRIFQDVWEILNRKESLVEFSNFRHSLVRELLVVAGVHLINQ